MPKWLKWTLIALAILIVFAPVLAGDVVEGFIDFLGTVKDNTAKFFEELGG